MKRVVSLIIGLMVAGAGTAFAGEKFLGTIFVLDAGSVHSAFAEDGGGFNMHPRTKITVQCDANTYVCVDRLACTAATGVKVTIDQAFPTTTEGPQTVVNSVDAGVTRTSVVSVIPVTGATSTCRIWSRVGDEAL